MPTQIPVEELLFTFPDGVRAEDLDRGGKRGQADGIKLVDLVIEDDGRILLVEVKDPSHTGALDTERERFMQAMQTRELLPQLAAKARGSYMFLHLMEQDTHPMAYVVVLGLEACPHDPALLMAFRDRLAHRIRHEGQEPWKREYLTGCAVLTTESWTEFLPAYGLQRVPNDTTAGG